MYLVRSEDTKVKQVHKRSDRFLVSPRGIHYKTREGELRGPFSTESRARFDLNIFIEINQLQKQLQQDNDLQRAWG